MSNTYVACCVSWSKCPTYFLSKANRSSVDHVFVIGRAIRCYDPDSLTRIGSTAKEASLGNTCNVTG